MNSTALKPVNSATIQPDHSMTPSIPSAPAPVSEDVLKCTSAGETLKEPGTAPGLSQQGEQGNSPGISPQEQSGTVEVPHQQRRGQLNIFEDKNINCPHPKYHEKLMVDLDAEEMSVLKDAFTKARKESGMRYRPSLLIHIAKAFLEGCQSSGTRRKPRYQIVLHRHLPSDLTWCITEKGERPVSPEILEKALCDAEIVELDETEDPTGDQHEEKATESSIINEDDGSKNIDILKEAHDYINEQYMKMY